MLRRSTACAGTATTEHEMKLDTEVTGTDSQRASARAPVSLVVQQHVEDAAHLRHFRTTLIRAPHPWLRQLARLDERIAAHLDGIGIAGATGTTRRLAALDPPGAGAVFTVAVGAIESRDTALLQRLLAVAQAETGAARGLRSAFGWVSASSLVGIIRRLLDSADPWWRGLGLTACAMHQADPGVVLLRESLRSDDSGLQVHALRTAASLGRAELRTDCTALAQVDGEPEAVFEAARAAILLGDRERSVSALCALVQVDGPIGAAALGWLLRLSEPKHGRARLQRLHAVDGVTRTLIRAIGIAGDPHYMPWLIERMGELPLARLAGETFTWITGADLALLDLERRPPGDDVEPPLGDETALDEDDGLPWPDPERIAHWWGLNAARFTAGHRYFMGQEPSVSAMRHVLTTGRQRQRIAAAEWLSLLQPGTPLFNTAAPAWRQQRRLARVGG